MLQLSLMPTCSHNISHKKPLTLLKKEHEPLTLRKKAARAWEKRKKKLI